MRDEDDGEKESSSLEGSDELSPRAISRVSSNAEFARPRAPKTSMSLLTGLLVAGILVILGLYIFYPSFFTGRP